MATTPTLALPYLAWNEPPDLPANNQALAQAVEAILSGRIQHGAATMVGNGTRTQAMTVTFDVPFPAAPRVLVNYLTTVSGDAKYFATVDSITTTGFVARISQAGTTTWTDPRRLAWLAIGI